MTDPDLAGYDTAVIDTAGRALDDLSATLITDDPKNANRSGGLSLPGYGALKTTFATWLKRLTSSGLDVVLLAHMDEQRKGDDIIERLDIQGGTKNEIYKSADAMGRLYMENGVRRLAFSPSDVAHGKNPGRLETLEVPSFDGGQNQRFLGDVIRRIKATLNEETEVVRRGRELLEAKRLAFAELTTPDTFTAEAVALAGANASPAVKRLLVQVAKERGYRFDAETHGFVELEAPAAAPAETSVAPRVELPTKATERRPKAAADAK